MKLFNRKQNASKDKVANGVARLIIKMQNGFAKLMAKLTENISSSSMKTAIILFFLFGTSLSTYFIIAAFVGKKSKAMKIDRISVPKYYNENGDQSLQSNFFITKEEHEKMQAFKKYMDSLQQSPTGKHIYDSISFYRLGLLDSINQLESIYQSQNKK